MYGLNEKNACSVLDKVDIHLMGVVASIYKSMNQSIKW